MIQYCRQYSQLSVSVTVSLATSTAIIFEFRTQTKQKLSARAYNLPSHLIGNQLLYLFYESQKNGWGTNQILDLVVDVKLLKLILKKQDARVWTRFEWLGVGSRVVSGA
jgi:hypothetical protein